MKIVNSGRGVRTAYAVQEGDEFLLSPFSEVRNSRRPIARFDAREELEAVCAARNCEVQWLDS